MAQVVKDGSSKLRATEFSKVHRRMLDLEQELVEFQESSKDLEQALEDELHQLETQKAMLLSQLQSKEKLISSLNDRLLSFNMEVSELSNSMLESTAKYEKIIAGLKHKLVAMEISNDDILSKDRVVESKLHLSNQFNNELLEKLAMVENDLELERQASAHYRLTISNLYNSTTTKTSRITHVKRDNTYTDLAFAESTVLDIDEMLATEPPVPPSKSNIPRSESLQRFQELCSKSDELKQKVDDFNSSLTLKSPSTAEISDPSAISVLSERSTSLGQKISDMRINNTNMEGLPNHKEISLHDTTSSYDMDMARVDTSKSEISIPPHKRSIAFSGIREKLSRKSKLRNAMKNLLG